MQWYSSFQQLYLTRLCNGYKVFYRKFTEMQQESIILQLAISIYLKFTRSTISKSLTCSAYELLRYRIWESATILVIPTIVRFMFMHWIVERGEPRSRRRKRPRCNVRPFRTGPSPRMHLHAGTGASRLVLFTPWFRDAHPCQLTGLAEGISRGGRGRGGSPRCKMILHEDTSAWIVSDQVHWVWSITEEEEEEGVWRRRQREAVYYAYVLNAKSSGTRVHGAVSLHSARP